MLNLQSFGLCRCYHILNKVSRRAYLGEGKHETAGTDSDLGAQRYRKCGLMGFWMLREQAMGGGTVRGEHVGDYVLGRKQSLFNNHEV